MWKRTLRPASLLPLCTLLCALLIAFPATAQDEAAAEKEEIKPTLHLEKLVITPEKPGVDTLCQLRVHVRNSGETKVSSLGFKVSLGGQSLPVYDKQLFLDEIPPGETVEVKLYNFWTTETGRDAPKDGKLKVDVELTEAQILTTATEEDGTEVWTLGDAVAGLPASVSTTLKLGS